MKNKEWRALLQYAQDGVGVGVGGGGHIVVLWYNGDLFKVLFMYIIGKKKMFQVIILELFYFLHRSIYGLIVMNW